jgi:hypothetical protein
MKNSKKEYVLISAQISQPEIPVRSRLYVSAPFHSPDENWCFLFNEEGNLAERNIGNAERRACHQKDCKCDKKYRIEKGEDWMRGSRS